eukprot:7384780-Prymnesium_polylepis.2
MKEQPPSDRIDARHVSTQRERLRIQRVEFRRRTLEAAQHSQRPPHHHHDRRVGRRAPHSFDEEWQLIRLKVAGDV